MTAHEEATIDLGALDYAIDQADGRDHDKLYESDFKVIYEAARAYLALKRTPAPVRDAVGWKWYGYAGHFIGGKRCAYHLCTRIEGYLISTVGHYMPKGTDEMDTIGAGEASFFETYIFKCSGEDKNGDPIIDDWSKIDGERYATSIEAERGHYRYLKKYALQSPPLLGDCKSCDGDGIVEYAEGRGFPCGNCKPVTDEFKCGFMAGITAQEVHDDEDAPLTDERKNALAGLERLANTRMDMSLEEWSKISSNIRTALSQRDPQGLVTALRGKAQEAIDILLNDEYGDCHDQVITILKEVL